VHISNSLLETPLHVATKIEHVELVEILLKSGADCYKEDAHKVIPYGIALSKNNIKILDLFNRYLPNSSPNTPNPVISQPAIITQPTITQQVITQSSITQPDNNIDPFTLIWNGNFEKLLIWATTLDHPKNVINSKRNPNFDNSSLLHTAVAAGKEDIVKWLLELGVEVNVKNSKGNTPLHSAVYRNSVSLVRRLIEKGADKTIKNLKGERPIDTTNDQTNPGIYQYFF